MTNQASEDEPIKSKVDWSTPYDEWLIPILNRFRYGGAIECRAIPSEIQLNIEAIIRTEKLKLLAEVRERVIGEDYDIPAEMEKVGRDFQKLDAIAKTGGLLNKFKADLRTKLTKLEAEL